MTGTGTSSRRRRPRFPRVLLAGRADDPLVVVRSGTWKYNSIGVWSGDEVLLVDPGLSAVERAMTAALACAREGRPPRRVTHLVLTHAHHDHMRGSGEFQGARTWMPRVAAEKDPPARDRILAAGEALGRRLGDEPPGLAWPTVDERFEGVAQFTFGDGEPVELHFLPGHSNCTSVVLLPRLATLLTADYLVRPGLPYCRHEASLFETALGRLEALAQDRGVECVVPAHGPLLLGRDAIAAALALERTTFAAMRGAIRESLDAGFNPDQAVAQAIRAAEETRGFAAGLEAAQDEDNARRLLREEQARA